MAIDTSIYQSIRPVEIPSILDSQSRAMNLSQLAMQNAHTASQLSRENKAAQEADKQKSLIAIGGAVENILKLPKDQWESAYNNEVGGLVKSGHLGPQDAPPFSEQMLGSIYGQLNSNPQWLQLKKTQAEIASSKFDPIDRDLDRQFKKSQIAKNNAEAAKEKNEAKNGKDPSQSQFAAAAFGTRASQAEKVFSDLAQSGFDPTTAYNVAQSKFPGFLEGNKSNQVKQQQQAQRNFVNAILRRESGAAISDSEFENAGKQYFPQYRDSADVLRQKEENRKIAIASLNAEGAPAMSRVSNAMGDMEIGSSVPAKKDAGLLPSANANEVAPKKQSAKLPPLPQGLIYMEDPSGNIMKVPYTMKGKVIANGGKVHK